MLIGGEQADADWLVRFNSTKEHSANIPHNPELKSSRRTHSPFFPQTAQNLLFFFSLILS
jgi:hypothetical protein